MGKADILKEISDLGAVLVVRAKDPARALLGIKAVVEGGLKAVEITFTVPGAADLMRSVGKDLGDAVLLGAGTVTKPEQVTEALNAGAKYIVAPNTNIAVIAEAKKHDLLMIPGALTPSEVQHAWESGADAVKIFPSSLGGPGYIKALKGPFPNIPMMATGGVNDGNVGDFFAAGCCAVGAGGNLFHEGLMEAGDWGEMTQVAKEFMDAVKAGKK